MGCKYGFICLRIIVIKPIINEVILENDCLEFSSWSSKSNDI